MSHTFRTQKRPTMRLIISKQRLQRNRTRGRFLSERCFLFPVSNLSLCQHFWTEMLIELGRLCPRRTFPMWLGGLRPPFRQKGRRPLQIWAGVLHDWVSIGEASQAHRHAPHLSSALSSRAPLPEAPQGVGQRPHKAACHAPHRARCLAEGRGWRVDGEG